MGLKPKNNPVKPLAAVDRGTNEEEKASVGVPLARLVPRSLVPSPELVVVSEPRSYPTERFRRLGALLAADGEDGPRVLAITSAAPDEGKSLVAMNLALTVASGGDRRTLVVDGDLRRPTLEHWVKPEPKLGLSDILLGKTTIEHAVLDLQESPLKLLPAGDPPPRPVELLSSDRMQNLFHSLRGEYDWIVVDTPPVLPFADTDVIAGHCDGVVIVVRSGKTTARMLEQAVDTIASAPILGTVLNDAKRNLADSNRSYESHYHRYYSTDRSK